MGVFSEYLDKGLDTAALTAERKKQLTRISQLRGGSQVLVFAADLTKGKQPISINYADLVPFGDQLANLSGDSVDVILETRQTRADEIAAILCSHGKWLTHARSIKIADLEAMRLRITDYATQPELHDAVQRYHALLTITFMTNVYKLFETVTTQVYKFEPLVGGPIGPGAGIPEMALLDGRCAKCGHVTKLQANLQAGFPLQPGAVPFPADNKFKCPSCGNEADLSNVRRQLEMQTKRPIMADGGGSP